MATKTFTHHRQVFLPLTPELAFLLLVQLARRVLFQPLLDLPIRLHPTRHRSLHLLGLIVRTASMMALMASTGLVSRMALRNQRKLRRLEQSQLKAIKISVAIAA